MSFGACKNSDTEIFFTEAKENPTAAAICGGCSVRDECLDHALEHKIPYGVWGGLTEHQRRQVLRKKQRVRCPGCLGTQVASLERYEACLACGLTWFA